MQKSRGGGGPGCFNHPVPLLKSSLEDSSTFRHTWCYDASRRRHSMPELRTLLYLAKTLERLSFPTHLLSCHVRIPIVTWCMCQSRISRLTQTRPWRSIRAVQILSELGAGLVVRRSSTGRRSGRICMTLQLGQSKLVNVGVYGANWGNGSIGRASWIILRTR